MSQLMGIFMFFQTSIITLLLYIVAASALSIEGRRIYQHQATGDDQNGHQTSTNPTMPLKTASIASLLVNSEDDFNHRHSQDNEFNDNQQMDNADWANKIENPPEEKQSIEYLSSLSSGQFEGGTNGGLIQADGTSYGASKQNSLDGLGEDVEMYTNNHQSSSMNENSNSHHSRHYNTYQMASDRPATLVTPIYSHNSNHNNKFLLSTNSHPQYANSNFNLNYIHNFLSKPSSNMQNSQNHQHNPPSNHHGLTLQGIGLPSSFHYSANVIQSTGQGHNRPHLSPVSSSSSIISNLVQDQSSSDGNTLSLADLPGSSVCGRQQIGYREPRIVGGNSTFEGEFPWAVSIQRHGNHHCGGVIVGKRWILTAAHCVRSQLVGSLIVRTGGHTLSRSGNHITSHLERDYVVDQIVMHDDFSRYDNLTASQMKSSANTNNADIALLRLRHDIYWNEFAWPVCFPNKESGNFSGHDAIVIGWGKLNEKSEDFSNELQKVKLTIIDNKVCQNWFRQAGREMPIDDRVMCAGFKNGGKDACHGDSGGPLLSRINGQYVVVGVVSTGIGCARPLLPGLYSRVSSYIGWIERYIT